MTVVGVLYVHNVVVSCKWFVCIMLCGYLFIYTRGILYNDAPLPGLCLFFHFVKALFFLGDFENGG